MIKISLIPDVGRGEFSDGSGITAFDELYRFSGRNFDRRSDQDVDMVRHDNEGVEEEVALVAIVKEGLDEEVGVGGDLEVAMLLMG